jgi:protein-disulfide isomerase/uncharacterized membrane protein/rhodanese-related sulfurtransferase
MRKVLLLILSLAGLFDALYLWWVYSSPTHPIVCLDTGCDLIRASHYAHLWGQPLPVYGAAMYLALAAAIFAQAWIAFPPAARMAQWLVTLISAGGVAFSVYLTALEAFVIHAYCTWCLGSAVIVTLIFALSFVDLRRGARIESPAAQPALRKGLRRGMITALVAVAVVEGLAFRWLVGRPELPPMTTVSAQTLNEALVRPDSHATGNLSSPVTVVEFGDFECPGCGQAQPIVSQMLGQYGDRIRFVFRQFPLKNIHPYAEKAAEASECAADQGKFWEAERRLYDGQSDLSEAALERYAGEIGLDVPRFKACLESGRMAERVQRDVADGRAAGVRATPTFFIGHQVIEGPPALPALARLLDPQLAQHGVTASKAASGPGGAVTSSGASVSRGEPGSSGSPPNAAGAGASSGDLGSFGSSNSASAFNPSANSGLACSEDELKKQQPALIRTPEAQQLFHSNPKPVFVDVRPTGEFAGDHLPGAINIPVGQMEARSPTLPKDKTLVLYESGKSGGSASDVCAVSRAGARILLAHGFNYAQVKVYQDGLAGWQKAGLPVER